MTLKPKLSEQPFKKERNGTDRRSVGGPGASSNKLIKGSSGK